MVDILEMEFQRVVSYWVCWELLNHLFSSKPPIFILTVSSSLSTKERTSISQVLFVGYSTALVTSVGLSNRISRPLVQYWSLIISSLLIGTAHKARR